MPNLPQTPTPGSTGRTVVPTDSEFRWDTLPPPDRLWLRARTDDVLSVAYRTACDTVRIGLTLADVKRRLPRGRFDAWIEAVLPFSRAAAYRYLQVAGAFGAFVSSQFETFDESALYVLAQLQTPPAARAHAVQLARDGKRITRTLALEILDAHRPVPDDAPAESPEAEEPEPKERTCLGPECGRPFRAAFPGFCEECKKKLAAGTGEYELAPDAALKRWRVVEALVKASTDVRITKVEDTDDPEPLYSVTCYRPDDTPAVAVRRDLYDALAVAAGCEETRYCSGWCKADVPVGQFGQNRLNPGGLMYRCRVCEKRRRKAMREAERAARAEANQSPLSGARAA